MNVSRKIILAGALGAVLLVPSLAVAQMPAAGNEAPFLLVLGIAQDGGYPQAGCDKSCCRAAWANPAVRKNVAALAIVDPQGRRRWLIDATPDFRTQLRMLDKASAPAGSPDLAGILLTHAHIGHYTGLMHLGREAMGARNVPVFTMPRMEEFLRDNGPWSQLVALRNIVLVPLRDRVPQTLNARITVVPFLVPHRDEFSETVGFLVRGPSHRIAYIPDIDKWEKWDRPIEVLLQEVDIAFLDGTFFADGEIPGRDMAEIPHPFIEESMQRFSGLPAATRAKVYFIHLNHTNPALQAESAERRRIEAAGMHIADEGLRFSL